MSLEDIERNLGYTFKDKNLLKRALTLSSADNQNNNQTLEFFGDAILEFLVSEKIYDQNESEGSLTEKRKALVADSALTPVSIKLGLDKALIRNPYDTNNKKAVPSAYEAVTAAIYLDGGIEEARKFVYSTLNFKVAEKPKNYKGELQEYLQGIGEPVPEYNAQPVGTPQNRKYSVSITVFGQTFTAETQSKKGASGGEQLVAKAALEWIKANKQQN